MPGNDQVQNLINGDSKAFSEIYRRYYHRMYAFANSYVRDSFVAGNLVHDAFMAFWENRQKLSPQTNIPAYLLTIVKNNALNHLNRLKTQLRIADDIQTHYIRELELRCSTLNACNPDSMFHADVEKIIQKTIGALPEQCRRVFILSRFQDLSHKEIADKLDISVKGVEFHITRALKSLREGLKDYISCIWWLLAFTIH